MERHWHLTLVIVVTLALVSGPLPARAAATPSASASSSSSGGEVISSSSSSSAAQRQSVDSSGTRNGECAYVDARGTSIKIRYTEYPDGRLEAEVPGEGPLKDPAGELAKCRQAVKETRMEVEDRLQQTRMEMDRNRVFLRQMIDNFARRIPPFIDDQDDILARDVFP